MKIDNRTYRLTDNGNVGKISLTAAAIGIILSLIGFFVDADQFFHSYLTSFFYWLSIALGGLFFVMLHHLVNATWSIVLRRLSENIMSVLPFMAIFAVILVSGLGHLYHWSHPEIVAADNLLKGKAPYLNTTFFVIRMIVYFAVWFLISRGLYITSLRQDSGFDESHVARMRKISAPGMILYALTLTFAAFDWLMSLDAHWYSTIYGVYVFAGSLLGFLAFLTLLALFLQRNNILKNEITVEHHHDLGKLIFVFLVFWGYMAFSQYLLIWYGNIPEETVWFLHRWEGSWKSITLLLVFGHFVVPFFLMFPRAPKRNPVILALISIWILIIHWVDLHWLVMPSLHNHGVHFSWMDITTCLAIGGIFIWLLWRKMKSQPLLPVNDPRLGKSIDFINY